MSEAKPSAWRDALSVPKEAGSHRAPRPAAALCRAGIRPATKPPWRSPSAALRCVHRAASAGVRGRGGWSPGLRRWSRVSSGGFRPGESNPMPFRANHGCDAGFEPATPELTAPCSSIELIAHHAPPAEPVVSKHTDPKRGRVDGRRRVVKDAEGLEPSRRAMRARAARRGRPMGPSCVCGCQRAAGLEPFQETTAPSARTDRATARDTEHSRWACDPSVDAQPQHARHRGARQRTRGRHTRCISGGGVGSRNPLPTPGN